VTVSVATQTAAPGVIRVGCLSCGMTTGVDRAKVSPCRRCRSLELVDLGPWQPQPGIYTIRDLFDRGRLRYEARRFGEAVRVRRLT